MWISRQMSEAGAHRAQTHKSPFSIFRASSNFGRLFISTARRSIANLICLTAE